MVYYFRVVLGFLLLTIFFRFLVGVGWVFFFVCCGFFCFVFAWFVVYVVWVVLFVLVGGGLCCVFFVFLFVGWF